MSDNWHPRGTPSWPDWKSAKEGTRVQHVKTGRTGTLRRAVLGRTPGNMFAVVQWDNDALGRPVEPGKGVVGRVTSPAFDLKEIAP